MFIDKRGIRAEHAEILKLALPESCWPDDAMLTLAKELLYERYRVPISGFEEVPDWVTENLRLARLPPDDAKLDLDMLNLRV